MRTAYSVETVRAAERELMARLPEGALMQRAAAGLAAACADAAAARVYGARVVLLVGSGDNGGDALYAGARLARRGAGVTAVLLAPDRAHQGGLAALRAARRAGTRTAPTADRPSPGRSGRRRHRRHRRHAAGCGRTPRALVRAACRGRRSSPSTCRAEWTRTPARCGATPYAPM